MARCPAKHDDMTCIRGETLHKDHRNAVGTEWPNEGYVARKPKVDTKALIKELAAQISKPLVRSDDPETSHRAIQNYEPKLKTAKGRVAQMLLDNLGQWIDAPRFTVKEIGGFAGTRRLRELREAHGWNIETREKHDGSNTWQHRLAELPYQGDL